MKKDKFTAQVTKPKRLRLFKSSKFRILDLSRLLPTAQGLVLILLCRAAYGGVGESSCNFLKLDLSSRSAALGSSLVALADDIQSAVYSNPAGLVQIRYKNLACTYNRGAAGINYQNINLSSPIGKTHHIALSTVYLSVGKLQYSYDAGQNYSAGDLGKEFSAYSLSVTLSYAKKVVDNLAFGINLKRIQEKIEVEQASTYAIDIGLLYKDIQDRYGVGFSIQNLSGGIKFIKDKSPLPLILKTGISYKPIDNVVLLLQADKPKYADKDKAINIRAGVECSTLGELLTFRCGYNHNKDIGSKISFGLGLKLFNKLFLDYAFIPYNEIISNTSSFSLLIRF